MFETFCKVPKPIIWGNIFKALKGESETETLKRCYKKLLDFRIQKYKLLAKKIIAYRIHRHAKEAAALNR
jgi:hypothetical protein